MCEVYLLRVKRYRYRISFKQTKIPFLGSGTGTYSIVDTGTVPLCGVVKPFNFDPAPAPASHDGGPGSSTVPVVHNFFLYKNLLLNLLAFVLFSERYK